MRTNGHMDIIPEGNKMALALDRMFRYRNSARISHRDAADMIYKLVSKGWFQLVHYQYDPLPSELAEMYIQKHGTWDHQGGHTRGHNNLGMRWAMQMELEGHTVMLGDSPDISGELDLPAETNGPNGEVLPPLKTRICGDVGQCSLWPAFMLSGCFMSRGNLWISVFPGEEYILEAQDTIQKAFNRQIETCFEAVTMPHNTQHP